jgi:hypothetical protein
VFEYLPSYSLELNPVEQCWQHMKNVQMANFVPFCIEDIVEKTLEAAQVINNDPKLLAAFFHHAKLALGRMCSRQGYNSCNAGRKDIQMRLRIIKLMRRYAVSETPNEDGMYDLVPFDTNEADFNEAFEQECLDDELDALVKSKIIT